MKTSRLFSLLLLLPLGLWGQVNDDFSDGDFTANPPWSGDVARWQVNVADELQSQGNAATEEIYLSTTSMRLADTEWQVYLRYASGGPSGSNQMRFYLAADQADLKGDLNGYFVEVGESGSNDSYDLYRQDGSSRTRLIDGVDGLAGAGIDATLRVRRDAVGNWQLSVDVGDGIFQPQGSAFDDTHLSSSFLGVWVSHTSTRADDFFFDDVYAGEEQVDTLPPDLIAVEAMALDSLRVGFSEPLDEVSAQNPQHYSLDQGLGNPTAVALDPNDPTQVTLSLGSNLSNNQSYQLTVQNLADRSGNAMAQPQSLGFSALIPAAAAPRDVVLNELMPDPSPSQGLPTAEFIEIYNRSGKVLDLEGWTISDASSSGTLPARILQPGEYLLIVDPDDAPLLASYGPLISPNNLPGLNNDGDQVVLKDATGVAIDSLAYDLSWYQDPAKADGGFTLELINPENSVCPPAANWRASQAPQGGTPGQPNSVFSLQPETEPPSLRAAVATEPNEVRVCFSEVMDPALLADPSHYDLSPNLGVPQSATPDANATCVTLVFSGTLPRGEVFTLTVEDLSDCSGNALAGDPSLPVARGVLAQPYDVVINEFMPDPEPSVGLPEAEFVELYNRSGRAIELSNAQLSDGVSTVQWNDLVLLPGEFLIVCEDDFAADFSALGPTLGLSSLPSQNNSGDTLRLLSPFGAVLEEVIYEDEWYQDEARRGNGHSLERIDADFVACNRATNWRASQAPSGGTPGQPNSMAGDFVDEEAPSVVSLAPTANGILLRFSEPLDLTSLLNPATYAADQGLGEPLLALPASVLNDAVELVFASPLDTNRAYRLQIDGLADCLGNELRTSLSFGLPVAPQPGDLLINEVLFNPYTGGADFVEVANASENILDLQRLQLGEGLPGTDSIFNADPVSESSQLLLPGQLVCLTRDVAVQRATYRPPSEARFLAMGAFPSYDDREGEVVLFTADSLVLDRFFYADDYHYPTLEDDDGVSLERLSLRRPTQDPDNWHSASSLVGYATPGYANSQAQELAAGDSEVYLGREVFSPNLDGEADVLPIHYQFDFVGANARVYIYDTRGHLVRRLQENLLLDPAPGVFFWDGFDEQGQRAPLGMYVVLFEVVNDDTGERKAYRRVAVLADRLD